MDTVKVLFVCMGNICRSPTAHGVFERYVEQAGLQGCINVDSAGTHAYHIGEQPDRRSQEVARGRGYDLSSQRARRIASRDFEEFDYYLVMDKSNLHDVLAECPSQYRDKISLFLDYAEGYEGMEVPDPYYGGAQGFDRVLDLVEAASEGLLAHIRRTYNV
ncbi:MAG: low molecular weight protein-tyrosine-phosphatase [bacterium]